MEDLLQVQSPWQVQGAAELIRGSGGGDVSPAWLNVSLASRRRERERGTHPATALPHSHEVDSVLGPHPQVAPHCKNRVAKVTGQFEQRRVVVSERKVSGGEGRRTEQLAPQEQFPP